MPLRGVGTAGVLVLLADLAGGAIDDDLWAGDGLAELDLTCGAGVCFGIDDGAGSREGFLSKTGSLEPKRGMPVGLVAVCEGGSMFRGVYLVPLAQTH